MYWQIRSSSICHCTLWIRYVTPFLAYLIRSSGARTRDLTHPMRAFYQLNYTPIGDYIPELKHSPPATWHPPGVCYTIIDGKRYHSKNQKLGWSTRGSCTNERFWCTMWRAINTAKGGSCRCQRSNAKDHRKRTCPMYKVCRAQAGDGKTFCRINSPRVLADN